jgi:selenocysteine lyase/cysteine desulfurase
LITRNANLGGAFGRSQATGDLLAHARQRVAGFLGARSADEVGFGLNVTSLNFSVSRAATRHLQSGDEVAVTALDHDADIAPWTEAANDLGLIVRTISVGPDSRPDMTALARAIGPRTRIVAFPYANNGIGTAVDVAEIVRLAHDAHAIAWTDLTHFAPHAPANVDLLDVDVAICSAYKFFGPHVGLFYVRSTVADQWQPHQLAHALHCPGSRPVRARHAAVRVVGRSGRCTGLCGQRRLGGHRRA